MMRRKLITLTLLAIVFTFYWVDYGITQEVVQALFNSLFVGPYFKIRTGFNHEVVLVFIKLGSEFVMYIFYQHIKREVLNF